MSNFDERLRNAVQRGQRLSEEKAQREQAKKASAEELRRLHTQYRLKLSDHAKACLERLPDYFPGFQIETIVGDRGWGAAASRDDLIITPGRKRDTFFSRLEIVVRPHSKYNVVDLAVKGTVRNKELINRSYFKDIVEVDIDEFMELIDTWTVEYAGLYAAKQ